MIDTSLIDKEFEIMVKKWRIASQLGVSPVMLRHLRYKVKHNRAIRLETKIKLLQRYGYRLESFQYGDRDLVAALKFYNQASETARSMGVEYIIEKFKLSREITIPK